MKQNYELLNWDSNLFEFKVAKIIDNKLNVGELEKTLKELKKVKIRLVYWATDNKDKNLSRSLKIFNAFLTGQRIIYVKKIASPEISSKTQASFKIGGYNKKRPENELIDLIIDGAKYSRFYVDPKITKKQYEDLHKIWITNSVKENKIFVIKENKKIIGFVSLNQKNNRGNIDFIVVNKRYRGKGLATALLNKAHDWFLINNYNQVQAVTQKENIASCKMYEKLGYKLEKTEEFYHFWI